MGAGRKTQTVDVDSKAYGQLSFEQRQRNLGPTQLKGCIFGCNHDTFNECVSNNLFGLPRAHWVYVQYITEGMPLFLFNYSNRQLHGVFEAAGDADWELEPTAWCRPGQKFTNYPCQVRVRRVSSPPPLEYNEYKEKLSNCVADDGTGNLHLRFELRMAEIKALIQSFSKKGDSAGFAPPRPPPATQAPAAAPAPAATSSAAFEGKTAASKAAASKAAAGRAPNGHAAQYAVEEPEEDGWQTAGKAKKGWVKAVEAPARPAWGAQSAPEPQAGPSRPQEHVQQRQHAHAPEPEPAGPAVPLPSWEELLTGLCSLGGHGSSSSKAGVQSLQLCVRTQALQEDQDPSRPQARDPPAAVPEPVPNGVHQPFPEAAPNEAPEENGAETVELLTEQEAAEQNAMFTELHTAMSRQSPDAADALWNALHVLSYRLSQQHKGQLQLTQHTKQLAEQNEALQRQVERMQAQLDAAPPPQAAAPQPAAAASAAGPAHAPAGPSTAGILYLLGGIGRDQDAACSTGVDAYDAANATWSTNCLHLPIACAWGAAASLERNLYVMGGSGDRADPASPNCMVYMPDRPAADTGDCWYQFPPMTMSRGGLSCAVVNNSIWAIGGTASREQAGQGNILTECEFADVSRAEWTQPLNMKTKIPRMSAGCVVVNGVIYLAGGHNLDNYLDTMERCDPRAPKWRMAGPAMGTVRSGPAVAVSPDGLSLMVAGGFNSREPLSSCDLFDIRMEQWREDVAPMSIPRSYACAALLGGGLHVVGGHSDHRPYSELGYDKVVERYDFASNSWQAQRWRPLGDWPDLNAFPAHCVMDLS